MSRPSVWLTGLLIGLISLPALGQAQDKKDRGGSRGSENRRSAQPDRGKSAPSPSASRERSRPQPSARPTDSSKSSRPTPNISPRQSSPQATPNRGNSRPSNTPSARDRGPSSSLESMRNRLQSTRPDNASRDRGPSSIDSLRERMQSTRPDNTPRDRGNSASPNRDATPGRSAQDIFNRLNQNRPDSGRREVNRPDLDRENAAPSNGNRNPAGRDFREMFNQQRPGNPASDRDSARPDRLQRNNLREELQREVDRMRNRPGDASDIRERLRDLNSDGNNGRDNGLNRPNTPNIPDRANGGRVGLPDRDRPSATLPGSGPGERPDRTEGPNRGPGERPDRTEGPNRGPGERPDRTEGSNRGPGERPDRAEGPNRGPGERPDRAEGPNRGPGERPDRAEGPNRGPGERPDRAEGPSRGPGDRDRGDNDARIARPDFDWRDRANRDPQFRDQLNRVRDKGSLDRGAIRDQLVNVENRDRDRDRHRDRRPGGNWDKDWDGRWDHNDRRHVPDNWYRYANNVRHNSHRHFNYGWNNRWYPNNRFLNSWYFHTYRPRPGYWWSWASPYRLSNWSFWGSYSTVPVYYDYGSTIVYDTQYVYVEDDPIATREQYALQAIALANEGRQILQNRPPTQGNGNPDDWLPLGVFVLTDTASGDGDIYLQLAVDKQGLLAGTYYNAVTDNSLPVWGKVDPESQRAAWLIGDSSATVMETGIYNLSQEASSVLVHYGTQRDETWMLVRLPEDEVTNTSLP
ncbi:hypothetical protein AB1L30_20770 [Bremerella sp. JC817]|uniref:hypothetical protein n=1 Tax=Bremerella sp. JC817 TaxID=3231756 RepID=UPI0034593B84